MRIDKEILSEKNYTGSRLIEITNEKVLEFQKELNALQQEANPTIEKLSEELWNYCDPLNAEIVKCQERIKEIKDEILVKNAEYSKETELLESIEQKAQLVKDKIMSIVFKELEGQLEEFEEAKHTVVKDDKVYVEVFDKIEEMIKAYRSKSA